MTRSVRRLPNPFVLEELGDVTTSPWEYGYAALGHRMMYNRHYSPPLPFGMPAIDVEAVQVRKYADEHPNEDLDDEHQTQAGQDASAPVPGMHSALSENGANQSSPTVEGQKRPELESSVESAEAKKARIGIEQPVTPPLDEPMDSSGERAPKTPKLQESPTQQMMQVTSTDLDLYEHEDNAVQFEFQDTDLDRLEQYDFDQRQHC